MELTLDKERFRASKSNNNLFISTDRAAIIVTSSGSSHKRLCGRWDLIIGKDRMIKAITGNEPHATHQRMILVGAIKAIELVEDPSLTILSNNIYLINGMTEGIGRWQQNSWTTADGNQVMHQTLWKRLIKLSSGRDIEWIWSTSTTFPAGNTAFRTV